MRALVTGATGFVGRRLIARLERPVVLSRSASRAKQKLAEHLCDAYDWHAETEAAPREAFHQVDTIFHLAGEPVADGRWTEQKKIKLRESRVAGTRHLVDALAQLPASKRPKTLVSASAIGYYGDRGSEELTESSPPVEDFLGEICVAWEREARRAEELGLRVVRVRIGIVLGPGGGPLAQMLPPFRFWAGSPLGSGKQWMSWIHLEDLVSLLLFAAEQADVAGAVNGTAAYPVTNREFTKELAKALGVPLVLPSVPLFALKTLLGDFAEILVVSQRVLPQAALERGFRFEFPELAGALRDILR